jgi:hydrogenase maturation protease
MSCCLVYGYGNPGRQDDGLGILLAERWESWAVKHGIDHIDFEFNYQLNIEDAHTISQYEIVIFADASVEDIEDIKLAKVEPTNRTEFTMHAMYPGFILHLCQSLYNASPNTYLLSMKAFEFEFNEEISAGAQRNLDMAFDMAIELFSMPKVSEVMASLQSSALLR